jgi:RepB DNA-primase from phage plasmid
MPPDTTQALAMIDAFQSVGATAFEISMIDIDENPKAELETRSPEELRRGLSARLEAASRAQLNLIVRPRSKGALFVQLDDLSADRVRAIAPLSFMTVRTSPNGNQVWLAVSDAPQDGTDDAKQFRKRVKAAGGADKSAHQAVRLAGSLNIKHKYEPDFPVVSVSQVNRGKTVTVAMLDAAGLIAPPDAVTPPGRAAKPIERPKPRADAPRYWPDYRRALAGAPFNKDHSGPDRSLADFMWSKWAAQRGWNEDEIAFKLMEVSDKARERAKKGDPGYAAKTAEKAVDVVERERGSRQSLKSTPEPRQ